MDGYRCRVEADRTGYSRSNTNGARRDRQGLRAELVVEHCRSETHAATPPLTLSAVDSLPNMRVELEFDAAGKCLGLLSRYWGVELRLKRQP